MLLEPHITPRTGYYDGPPSRPWSGFGGRQSMSWWRGVSSRDRSASVSGQ